MSNTTSCDIRRSPRGPFYEMSINGQFYGNYDSVKEATDDYEAYLEKQRKGEEVPA